MTISKGRRTHIKLIVLLRQSDFYCSGHQAGPSMNICCRVRRVANDEENMGKYIPPPFFLHVLDVERNTEVGANGEAKVRLTKEIRASGRGWDLRRSLLPCTRPHHSFLIRDGRMNAGRIARGKGGRPETEQTRARHARRKYATVSSVAAGHHFCTPHFLRLNEKEEEDSVEEEREDFKEARRAGRGPPPWFSLRVSRRRWFFSFLAPAGFPGDDWRHAAVLRGPFPSAFCSRVFAGGSKGRGNMPAYIFCIGCTYKSHEYRRTHIYTCPYRHLRTCVHMCRRRYRALSLVHIALRNHSFSNY